MEESLKKSPEQGEWRALCHKIVQTTELPPELLRAFELLEKQQAQPRFTPEGVYWPLTQGQWTLIDQADVNLVKRHSWFAVKSGEDFYARAKINGKAVPLHRFLCPEVKKNEKVDHQSGDTLDNRRDNLRPVDNFQSAQNRRYNRKLPKGVYERKTLEGVSRFRAIIRARNNRIQLGTFDTPEEAARAYDAAALEQHGEYASTNSGREQ